MKRVSVVILLFLLLNGCASYRNVTEEVRTILRIKGSDSMLLLVQQLADQFMVQHSGVSITVNGGGSGAGIRSLIDGSVEICATSRPLTPEEVRQLAQKYQSVGVSILVAKDALNIVVHPSNRVSDLSVRQVVDIFTGSTKWWNEIGGDDMPITVYGRETNSGTFLYFEEHVLLGAKYSSECVVVPGARGMIGAVAKDSTSIGYSTSVYAGNVKSVSIDGVVPTTANILKGFYPITRYLYFYTVHQPEGTIKKFLDWVVSKEGQNVAKANGYIPLYSIE
ncbi:MAG: phosphate ABC transporter substrate-binding protein [Bacteriovoracaceae bacterium]